MALLLGQGLACAAPAAPSAGPKPESRDAPGPAPAPATAPAASQVPPPAPERPERVVVGFFPSTTSTALRIAHEHGYFAEQGIEPDLSPFNSLPDAVAMLNAGQLEVYGGGAGVNLFNAVARGIELRAVADWARSEAGAKAKAAVARRDLWDSGEIRGLADLRGRTVSTIVSTGGQEYQLAKLLQTVGLTLDDVVLKGMTPADQLAALANKGTDAAYFFQPALCTAERRNLGVVLQPIFDDLAPGTHGGLLYYGEQFVRERAPAARAFTVAYLKAVREYTDAQRSGANRAQVMALMQKYVPMQDPNYYDECEWGRVNPDGYIDRHWLEDEMLWAVQAGFLDRAVSVDRFVDNTFVDHAQRVLGPYRPAGQ
jgi:NitT/TauT family transport system substrate-binding protein